MKNFKFLSIICFVLLACFMFAACGFGSYNLEFILPDGSVYKTHTYGPNDSLTSVQSAPNVIGYNFVGWSENERLESVIKVPYQIKTQKLYAKYEIDEDMFYSYSTINFSGDDVSLNYDHVLQTTYYILIKDTNSNPNENFSRIEVVANNSDFVLQSLALRDAKAKPINDGDSSLSVFAPTPAFEAVNQTEYVLKIVAVVGGDFTINIR